MCAHLEKAVDYSAFVLCNYILSAHSLESFL